MSGIGPPLGPQKQHKHQFPVVIPTRSARRPQTMYNPKIPPRIRKNIMLSVQKYNSGIVELVKLVEGRPVVGGCELIGENHREAINTHSTLV